MHLVENKDIDTEYSTYCIHRTSKKTIIKRDYHSPVWICCLVCSWGCMGIAKGVYSERKYYYEIGRGGESDVQSTAWDVHVHLDMRCVGTCDVLWLAVGTCQVPTLPNWVQWGAISEVCGHHGESWRIRFFELIQVGAYKIRTDFRILGHARSNLSRYAPNLDSAIFNEYCWYFQCTNISYLGIYITLLTPAFHVAWTLLCRLGQAASMPSNPENTKFNSELSAEFVSQLREACQMIERDMIICVWSSRGTFDQLDITVRLTLWPVLDWSMFSLFRMTPMWSSQHITSSRSKGGLCSHVAGYDTPRVKIAPHSTSIS